MAERGGDMKELIVALSPFEKSYGLAFANCVQRLTDMVLLFLIVPMFTVRVY